MTSINTTLNTLLPSGTNHLDIKQCLLPDIPPGEDILLVTSYRSGEHSITTARIVDDVNGMYYILNFADGRYGIYTLDYYNQPQLYKAVARSDAPELFHTTFYRISTP